MLTVLEGRIGQVESRLGQLLSDLEARDATIGSLEANLATECSKTALLDVELAEKEAKVSALMLDLEIKDATISEQGSMMQRNLLDYATQVQSLLLCLSPLQIF